MKYPYLKGNSNIIALHRVLHDAELDRKLVAIPSMEISSATLRNYILDLKGMGYKFVSLDEILLGSSSIGEKQLALTFDDGYIDFRDVILPILEELDVPACLYLVTGYPDDTCFHCFGILEDFVAKNNTIDFLWRNERYQFQNSSRDQKRKTLLELDAFIEAEVNGVSKVEEIFISMGVDQSDLKKTRALDWESARKLHQHPLITIGSHTVSHPRLSRLPIDEARREIISSKLRLEEKLGSKIDHFSYPYGDHNPEIMQLVQQAGYMTATTVKSGQYDGKQRFSINRHWLDNELNPIE